MYTKVANRWTKFRVWSRKTEFRKYLSLDLFMYQIINGSGRLFFSGIKTCMALWLYTSVFCTTSSMSVIAIKHNNSIEWVFPSFTVWNIFCLTTVHLNLFNPLWKLKVPEIEDIRLCVESMLNDNGDTFITRLTIV